MHRGTPAIVAALVAGLALAGTAFATHPSWREELRLNVDGDRAAERVELVYSVTSDHKVERGTITVMDTCAGRRASVPLVRAGSFVPSVALKPSQLGRPALGIAIAYKDGPRVARVVRLRRCRLRVLLAFSSETAAEVRLEARNASAAYPGREVVVIEGLRDAARRLFFRWLPSQQRYVRYRTEFSRSP